MIQQIIAMLQLDNHYGISEEIEIAKGKHEVKSTVKDIWKQSYREFKVKYNGRKKGN